MAGSTQERGYNLTEMMIVVALLGILGTAAIPSASPQSSFKVKAAASEIAAALNFARSEALRTGEFHGVNISTADSRIRVYKLNFATTPPAENYVVNHPLDKKLYDVSLTAVDASRGVAVSQSEFKFAGSASAESVTFNRYGAPVKVLSATSMAQLIADSKASVSLRGFSRQTRVDPETGRVTRL